jgi:phosphoglycerol transferase MdoB-like AlkP superfamily enzyme
MGIVCHASSMILDRYPWWSFITTRDFRAQVFASVVQLIVLPLLAVWGWERAITTSDGRWWFFLGLVTAGIAAAIYGAIQLKRFAARQRQQDALSPGTAAQAPNR